MNASVSNGTIGVIIRTLNESELIGRCLETLHGQQGGFELDVLVVDSGSTDSTLEIARDRGARILELAPAEFDYSRALNVGIEQLRRRCDREPVRSRDPDGRALLQRLTAPFEDPKVAGVAARQVPWPDAPWQEVHRLQDQFTTTPRVYSGADGDEILFSNAASSIRRSVWAAEPFTLPAVEDLEWARRVVAAGWKIVYEPAAVVYHSHYEDPRARARRLIDMSRVADAAGRSRTRRRTAREAAGLVARDSRAVLGLEEPLGRKLAYVGDVVQVAWYYVLDFSRSGTTAERRREDS